MIDPTWLTQEVPLYAFLAALLTSPAAWSRYVHKFASKLYERRFGDN